MFLFLTAFIPPKSILKKSCKQVQNINAHRLTIPFDDLEMIRSITRPFSVRLHRLDISKSLPKSKEPETAASPQEKIPTVTFCRNCSHSFDTIFENERKKYIAPYEKMLQAEIKVDELISARLTEANKHWGEEIKKWTYLAKQIDELMSKWNELVRINSDLQMRTTEYHLKVIMPEHNYAHNQFN